VSDSGPGKSQTEIVIETFVDRLMEIHPNLDRERLHESMSGCVHDSVSAADTEEGSGEDSEEDSGDGEE